MKAVTPTSSVSLPKYQQVQHAILEHIRREKLSPGAKVPSERVLSKLIGVSPLTVRRGFGELVEQGLLERRTGSGTYVANFGPSEQETAVKRIGLISRYRPDDRYFSKVSHGLGDALHEAGFELLTFHRPGDNYLAVLQEYGLAGLVLLSPLPECIPNIERVRMTGVPMVVVGFRYKALDDISFACDDYLGGKAAVEHLVQLGHRRIGVLGVANHPAFQMRVHGFQKAMFNAGLPLDPDWVLNADPYEGTGVQEALVPQMVEQLKRPNRPTAFFAASPYLLLTAYEAARQAGLSIPDQLSIIGFDEVPDGFYVSPAPTVFVQPLEDIGKAAAQGILCQIRNQEIPPKHYCPAVLVERSSCKPLL